MLSVGIVGLPNVGKSTLFSALTRKQVDCANFPFCTIEPNVGVVEVPDPRLQILADISKSQKVITAAIEFVDIAGLVRGAHKGEGLGNQFLGNIRQVDAICHVVRAFAAPDVTHVDGTVDPLRDAEVIDLELAMADLATVERRQERLAGKMKAGRTKELEIEERLLLRLREALGRGVRALSVEVAAEERDIMRELCLLTAKPMINIVNVSEQDAVSSSWESPLLDDRPSIPVSVKIEQELLELPETERPVFMEALGMKATGLDRLIRTCFEVLNLITFFTTGHKETRGWQVERGTRAPQAAGRIHTDFERGFIRAEVIPYEAFVPGGEVAAREAGKLRLEGKEYEMRDGDIVHFRVATS